MLKTRVIPVLLLKNKGLVKTKKFKNEVYIGDPINAIKIFNEKEVDELVFLDIKASYEKRQPDIKLLYEIAGECFMPLAYGGGIDSVEMIREILKAGVEKVIINTHALLNPQFIKEATDIYGSSTVVVALDIKKTLFRGYSTFVMNGKKDLGKDPVSVAVEMQKMGAGELLINSIDRDGMMQGFDVDLLKQISCNVDIPVIACGGAKSMNDFKEVVDYAKVSAVAAGSMFVFYGKHNAVLINYPDREEIEKYLQ